MSSNTPRLALEQPGGSDGPVLLRNAIVTNAGILDSAMIYTEGLLVDRPDVTAVAHGTQYYATDTNAFAWSNGTAWIPIGLAFVAVTGSASVSNGQSMTVNAANATITLPSPTAAGQLVGIRAGAGVTGSAPITITTPSGVIYGVGLLAASMKLGQFAAVVLLQSDGTNWNIISGQQNSGWVSLTFGTNVGSAGFYTPSARVQNDRVEFKGALKSTGVTPDGAALATLAVGLRPSGTVPLAVPIGTSITGTSITMQPITIAASGAISTANGLGLVNATYVLLDGYSFTLS